MDTKNVDKGGVLSVLLSVESQFVKRSTPEPFQVGDDRLTPDVSRLSTSLRVGEWR